MADTEACGAVCEDAACDNTPGHPGAHSMHVQGLTVALWMNFREDAQ